MQITFLGTGTSQGIPMIACPCPICSSIHLKDKRLRSSVLITINGYNIIIDTGTDFRQQMLREKVLRIDAVLFTHEHKDHTAGLDDIRAFNYFNKKKIPIYMSNNNASKILADYDYVFGNKGYPGVPELEANNIENKPFDLIIEDQFVCNIMPIEVLHHKLKIFGYRINDFVYITDANFIAEHEIEKIFGAKTLVLNALRHEKHLSHFTLNEAITLANFTKVPKTYFTHISHQLGFHHDIMNTLPSNMELAYDGLKIYLD
jgi:phosphoribosyl 1,2-cyclic phosphate phosphodiesterase